MRKSKFGFRARFLLPMLILGFVNLPVANARPSDHPKCKGVKQWYEGKCRYADEIEQLKREAKKKARKKKKNSKSPRKKTRKKATLTDGMVFVPGGTFEIGCVRANDENCLPGESPRHKVELDAYYIDQSEVTVEQFRKCVDAKACDISEVKTGIGECNWDKWNRNDHPINCVDWEQSRTFCEWKKKRLPTEAEWERAASGGEERFFPWKGRSAHCLFSVMLNVSWGCGKGRTWPVCSKPKGNTDAGLCDMAGNVSEWTQDFFSETFYVNSPRKDPMNGRDSGYRTHRGGSWTDTGELLRVSSRQRSKPKSRLHSVGFRCALSK